MAPMLPSLKASASLQTSLRCCPSNIPRTRRKSRTFPSALAAVGTQAAPSLASGESYAIVDLGAGVRTLVQEGNWYACSQQLGTTIQKPGSTVQFGKVVALKREDGEYLRGRPYLTDVVVEAIFEEEFPLVPAAGGSSNESTAGRYLVTKIVHSEANKHLLEQALQQ